MTPRNFRYGRSYRGSAWTDQSKYATRGTAASITPTVEHQGLSFRLVRDGTQQQVTRGGFFTQKPPGISPPFEDDPQWYGTGVGFRIVWMPPD